MPVPERAAFSLRLNKAARSATAAFMRLFELPRPYKRSLQLFADTVMIIFSFATAMLLRTEDWGVLAVPRVWIAPIMAVPVCLLVFYRLGFYRQVVRAMSGQALLTLVQGVAISTIAVVASAYLVGLPLPGTVPIIHALIAFCTVGGIRFTLRAIYSRTVHRDKTRVIIYGAGQSGRQLASSLLSGNDHAPVAFVDDSPELHGTQIGGLRVFSPSRLDELIREYNARVVLLAIPSISRSARAAIVARLEQLPVRVQIMPGTADMVSGRAATAEIREVMVEDVLGRDPVPPSRPLMAMTTTGKSVMVTGAGGSIGSELCRQILREGPRVVVLLERSEYALYKIDEELRALAAAERPDVRIVPLLGSVGDTDRVTTILRHFAVDTIYHAAAYKHMPIVEQNMVEGLSNNVFGTLNLARAAVAAGVASFILVSTDKAVRPTNIMGASKRMAELICQALEACSPRTRFSIVRFGNVLGSSGSVIPRFRKQIAQGGPVTVTHPEIARYFMTVSEAAQLVIQAAGLAKGGDVFVLDMGQPVKIVDLAQRMIRLSGYVPQIVTDRARLAQPRPADVIPIIFTQMRPGEKLVEELLTNGSAAETAHPRILTTVEPSLPWDRLVRVLDRLQEACRADDLPRIRAILASAPTGYVPAERIVDLTWTDVGMMGEAPVRTAERAAADALADRIAERLAEAMPRVEVPAPANTPTMPPRRERPAATPSAAPVSGSTAAGS
jgi:FlaA1/EpsC-like NDP-sugar epimerase